MFYCDVFPGLVIKLVSVNFPSKQSGIRATYCTINLTLTDQKSLRKYISVRIYRKSISGYVHTISDSFRSGLRTITVRPPVHT
jgi:hypothetical protein